jgi:glyoxylase-like metal-dependent hydrolase (beta-lactamase superfamily II)
MTIQQVEPAMLYDSNIYLLTGGRTALIDTGTGFQAGDTIASVRKALNGRGLDIVIITHRHYDHVGGLNAIINEFDPEVYAGAQDAVPLRAGDSESTLGTAFGGQIRPMDVKDLNDGDVIDIGAHRLRVIRTPGHTIGSISLYDEMTGSLFTGDTVFVDGVGRHDLPTASLDQLIDSLRRLSRLDINGFYPGHGPSVQKGGNEFVLRGLRTVGADI